MPLRGSKSYFDLKNNLQNSGCSLSIRAHLRRSFSRRWLAPLLLGLVGFVEVFQFQINLSSDLQSTGRLLLDRESFLLSAAKQNASENEIIHVQSKNEANALPQWLRDYIEFHQSWVHVDSKGRAQVKEGARYIVYECHGTCTGLGGRLKYMIKILYVAMCSRRVFLIDSPFPFPLQDFLNPNLIRWDASFPKTEDRIPVFSVNPPRTRRLHVPSNITGFVVDVAFGPQMWDMIYIQESQCISQLVQSRNYEPIRRSSEERLFHLGFHALFRFDTKVVSRAEEIKEQAGLNLNGGAVPPYLAIHVRTGNGPTWRDPKRHDKSTFQRFLNCSQVFLHEKQLPVGYVASDNPKAKPFFHEHETRFKFSSDLNIFHVDKSLSKSWATNFSNLKEFGTVKDERIAREGMLDLIAELKVLVDSSCLVMSKSGMSFAAHFIRKAPRCSVYIEFCEQDDIRQGTFSYAQRKTRLVVRPIPSQEILRSD